MQLSFPLDDDPLLPKVRARLRAGAGPCRDEPRRDPVSQLVRSMLGSKTRDEVSIRAFEQLHGRYPSWDALRQAAPQRIERAIWMVNHAARKAEQLPQALRMIVARSGGLALDFLADLEEEAAMRWLGDLPGVGPKIAASVLNFSTLRKRELVVDTHLLRVGERLGLLPAKPDYEAGHNGLMRLVPEGWTADELYELHRLIKSLGQTVCTVRAPACDRCPLQDLCPRRGC
ncbi:endonuclease-3 [Inquilinus ginsengisoli]|uniref:Endonuclease-3 n=1 Tax=Inquilinus ginsengisoli TaxID=363840 RepID=A0ABU1JRY5_9PROT|nr:Fe-S cluster assembly protein HesB [Inquilinus ginsengisoli]MDR6290340.1 endonuclease-3 [Inquilinus ginsengisoli]